MGIFDRMGKVISSNVNSILEKAEDDEKLLELNLEEMAAQLKAGRQDVVSAVAAEKQLRKKHDDLVSEVEKWDKRAELAMKGDDEALAREALKQKKRVSGEVEVVDKARIEQRDTALKMKAELERMEQKLEELKLRKGSIVSKAQQARGAASGELGARGGSSAFANFREMEEKIEDRAAQGSAMEEIEEALGTGKREDLEAKFRDLEHSLDKQGKPASGDSELDAEIAALKKRVRV